MDIGLIGFGGVGQALAGLLIEKKKYLREKYNLEINLKYIINSSGGIYNPEKIDLIHLINHIQKGKQISEYKDWGNYNIDSIIANGDVDSAVKAKEILNVTGCDLVMIGRGSLGNPWIFNQVNTFLDFGEIPALPTIEEKLQVIKKHVDLMCKYKGERLGIKESRKIIAWYIKGIHNAASFRKKSFEINSLCDLNYLLNEIKECNNI